MMNFFETFPECSLPSTVSKNTIKIGPQCVHVWLTKLSCFDIKRMWFVLEFLLVELTSDYG